MVRSTALQGSHCLQPPENPLWETYSRQRHPIHEAATRQGRPLQDLPEDRARKRTIPLIVGPSCVMHVALYDQSTNPFSSSRTMSAAPSEDDFLDRISRGSASAAAELDHRYRQRLCRLVQGALDCNIRQREDPEDVVQTVLRTYFRRAAQGEFQIADSSDLWALLAKITRRKILKRAEYHHAAKRRMGAETAMP